MERVPPSRAASAGLLHCCSTLAGALVLSDGRRCTILKNDQFVAAHIVDRVAELARSAIDSKGGFSMSIGSGTTVAPLAKLPADLDFSNFHVFFGNERTEGDAAGKCLKPALDAESSYVDVL